MLFELLKSWLAVDRIRVAPEIGRLLRLRVGDIVLLLNEQYLVQQRDVVGHRNGDRIRYVLNGDSGTGILVVTRPSNSGRTEGELALSDRMVPVFDQDVVILKSVCGT
ncbi:MAG: hypothetical protein R3C59_13520 [Planctomycetaceae bacterium]